MALFKLFQKIVMGLILAAMGARAETAQAIPGCPSSCGNITIPYPFGTHEGCYLNESYLITCHNIKAYLRSSPLTVLDISLEGQLRIEAPIAYECYNISGGLESSSDHSLYLSRFPISSKRNKFTAIGCDTSALIQGSFGQRYTTGCMSLCGGFEDVKNGSCSGNGCCQTSIPEGVQDYRITMGSFYHHEFVYNFSKCSYAFVTEEEYYNFSSTDLYALSNDSKFPLILDWAVGDTSCLQAKTNLTDYLCKENSVCLDSENGPGYLCKCAEGYGGNPYISNGCRDIDECQDPNLNGCTHTCSNIVGNHSCACPKGYHGDGRRNGQGCILDKRLSSAAPVVVSGLGVGLVLMLVVLSFTCWGVRKRQTLKRKESFFKQNGGIMLEQLLYKSETSSVERAKIFTEEELKKATNNFSESNIVGQGGYGTVYKGVLGDNVRVAIKKSKLVDRGQIEQFVNEVIILTQIKHPNVVKLLGCCLETPVPLLVYEFITNNTLFHHIHDEGCESSIPWEMRLRIATETAAALAHMHSAPMHIIHRDIKSANILLDDEYTARVSDFGVSRLVSLDETHLATLVQGTFGYIDPEYFHSGLLTQKSDVYSFGVVLVELLTGQKVVSFEREEKDRNLAMYFLSSLENDNLHKILEARVRKEGQAKQLKGLAELAKKCLRITGEKRPTMNEVKQELEAWRDFQNHPWLEIGPHVEDRQPLLGEPFMTSRTNCTTDFDSMKNHELLQLNCGGDDLTGRNLQVLVHS